MYFTVTTYKEEKLQEFLKDSTYKYMDFSKLQKEFESDELNRKSKHYDYHLNEFVTIKLLNSFKNYKADYFIYRIPSYDYKTIKNIKKFILDKNSKKFSAMFIIGNETPQEYSVYEAMNIKYISLDSLK